MTNSARPARRHWRTWVADQVPDPQARRYRAGATVRDWAQASMHAASARSVAAPVATTTSTLERHRAAVQAVHTALAAAGLPHFAYRESTTRVRFGLERSDRAAALRAIHRWATTGGHTVCLGFPAKAGVRAVRPLGDALGARILAESAVVVGLPVTDQQRQLVLGTEQGVRLDWWDRTADGALMAGSANRWAQRLPVEVQQAMPLHFYGQPLPSYAVLTDDHVDDVLGPIDAVVTWVDAEQEAWRERYRAAGGQDLGHEHHASRYRSLDELRFTLRSLATYAPWLHRIFLVTDGQRPGWLREGNGLTVVDHRELWPDPAALPVFNSHAIEARLHHIPGLADRWLYVNDDVLLGRDVPPEALFTSSGGARLFPAPLHVGFGRAGPDDGTPSLAGRTTRAVLAEATGRVQTAKLAHTPHPQLRGVAQELEERFPAEYERTWRARFRGPDDLAPITLQSWYGYATGRFVPGHLEERYYDLRTQALAAKLRYLAKHRHLDTFCLNMGEEPGTELVANESLVVEFLAAFLPFASPWEEQP